LPVHLTPFPTRRSSDLKTTSSFFSLFSSFHLLLGLLMCPGRESLTISGTTKTSRKSSPILLGLVQRPLHAPGFRLRARTRRTPRDRKSTRLNSSHEWIS